MTTSNVNENKPEFLDFVRTDSKNIKIGFIDRLKILFGIDFQIEVKIAKTSHIYSYVDAEITFITGSFSPQKWRWPVKPNFTVPAAKEKIKALYNKWHNSIYRLILACFSCFYLGYAFIFENPEKHLFFIKLIGVLAILKGINFGLDLYLKYLLEKLKQ